MPEERGAAEGGTGMVPAHPGVIPLSEQRLQGFASTVKLLVKNPVFGTRSIPQGDLFSVQKPLMP